MAAAMVNPDSGTQDEPLRVVIADRLRMVRSAIRALLDEIGGVRVVAEASNGDELLEAVDRERPALVISDVAMPGRDAIDTISEIHKRHPHLRVLVLSASDSAEIVRRAIASGASGYLVKTAPAVELEQAVTGIEAGGSYFSPSIMQALLEPAPASRPDGLTERQLQVVRLLARGHSSRQIGEELGLSAKTVDVHRARIMRQLGIRDMASLARYALRHGLVDD